MTNKEEFIAIFENDIIPEIPSAKNLLNFLITNTDFFTAPASMNHHSAVMGGLCLHSLNVYDRFMDLLRNEFGSIEKCGLSVAEASLLPLCHDICKVDTYKQTIRNKKVNGAWVEVPAWEFDCKFRLGHGARSLYYIQKFITGISPEAAQAIYYHQGGLDNPNEARDISPVYANNHIALLLHCADMLATFIDEKQFDQK